MRLAIVYSRASVALYAPLVTVEVHLSNGLPKFNIVGLPEKAVKESKDRVRSAIITAQFEFPCRHITVNLAPADLPKEGGRFDLPIALGILAASNQIPTKNLSQYEFVGELALSGEIRGVHAVLPAVLGCKKSQRTLIVPMTNLQEAQYVSDITLLPAQHLLEVCAHLKDVKHLHAQQATEQKAFVYKVDLADVKGQALAKRGLEIAASGGHNLLLIGPPGTGKSMLAARLPTLMPPLSEEAAIENATLTSLSQSNALQEAIWRRVPFRSPHHTASSVALVGGGRPPKPGEVSLAHHGVLFLDELPEFSRHSLECLREPLETGMITISRAGAQHTYPAQFQLIAAMNPCPCGYAGTSDGRCQCTPQQIKNYLAKLSGPLIDRIDMHISVQRLPEHLLFSTAAKNETSDEVRERIVRTHARQLKRQQKLNAHLNVAELQRVAPLDEPSKQLLQTAAQQFLFTARSIFRLHKLARTVADCAESDTISTEHLSEVLTMRALDRLKSRC